MKRGEIWWASLSPPKGSGPGYRRPVLIVQADEFNRSRINTVIALAITTNLALSGAPGNVRLGKRASGLPKDAVVNVSQMITVDKRFLSSRVRTVSLETMGQVDEGLRLVLAL